MLKSFKFLSHSLKSKFYFSVVMQKYEKLVQTNEIILDHKQKQLIEQLDDLSLKIHKQHDQWCNFVQSRREIQEQHTQENKTVQIPNDSRLGFIFKNAQDGKWGANRCEIADSIKETTKRKQKMLENYYRQFNQDNIAEIKGQYIYGSPGSGKTFLMDLFYETLEFKQKKRIHFNEFMVDVQKQLHFMQQNKVDDPLLEYAKQISKNIRVLCLDEFQVTDIADALILKNLFEHIFNHNIVVLSTSNRPPDDLYKNGLQRMLFMPFIPFLKEKCHIINIDSQVDHRYDNINEEQSSGIQSYLTPINKASEQYLNKIFHELSGNSKGEELKLKVFDSRYITIKNQCNGVAKFDFQELCQTSLGPSDFIAISKSFHSIIISGIPYISSNNRDSAKRFILLMDELYNQNVKLYVSAQYDIQNIIMNSKQAGQNDKYIVFNEEIVLLENQEIFALERSQSRLIEMQSSKYKQRLSYYDLQKQQNPYA